MKELHIIGCGGIGGWVLNCIIKSPKITNDYTLHFWDKDIVEENNLDRQFFTKKDIGRKKSLLFSTMVPNSEYHFDWFTENSNISNESVIIVCTDNNASRKNALFIADKTNSIVLIGANETIDAEAYIYLPSWLDTEKDPRKYYPNILEFDIFDPTIQHCTSHVALEYTPQLAIANMLAGSYIMFLFNLWLTVLPNKNIDDQKYSIYKINNTYGNIFHTKENIGS